MKVFFSEYAHDYSTYTFGYAVRCLMEKPDELDAIHNRGFLPITARNGFFYLCRSVRVDLDKFKDSSENKRVDRKIKELGIKLDIKEKKLFTPSSDFKKFCLKYISQRFTKKKGEEWLDRALNHIALTHVFSFCGKDKIYGYALCSLTDNMLHYWHPFFDTDYMGPYALGKWLMWRSIKLGREKGLKYVYLGTCYGNRALYKVRDHKGVEFFDGVRWNSDIALLKYLCHKDENQTENHDFFQSKDERESRIFQGLDS